MEMIFKFAASAHLGGDPQAVGEKLHQIRKGLGRLTPADVVEEAKPSGSVLHRYFEWDNKKAAQKWRITQARDLISAIVTVEVGNEETAPVRSFVSIDNSYEPVFKVMSDTELRQKALQEVQNSIEYLKDKIKAFEEFGDVLAALEQVAKVVKRKAKRVQAGRVMRSAVQQVAA